MTYEIWILNTELILTPPFGITCIPIVLRQCIFGALVVIKSLDKPNAVSRQSMNDSAPGNIYGYRFHEFDA